MLGTDVEVVARYNAGDRRALAELVERYTPRLRARLTRMFPRVEPDVRHEMVQDLLQEVWIRLARHLRTFDPSKSFSTWVFTIATNLAYNEHRRLRRENSNVQRIPLQIDSDGNANEMDLPDARHASRPDVMCEERDSLQRLMRHLYETGPKEHLEVLEMRELFGQSYDQMSKTLGVPEGTVKSRLARVRQSARHFRKKHGGE